MNNQKLENLLNLALEATEEEREKSRQLEVGYDPEEKKWELIVRHTGSLMFLEEQGIKVEELTGGYGILTVPENMIPFLVSIPEIEYIEKPKRLFFSIAQAKDSSCISYVQTDVQAGGLGLSGKGTVVAVIDSGIDYFHQDFRNPDGTTRILELWDQGQNRIYTEEEINQALAAGTREQGEMIVPSRDLSGHGTAVAGIAAGNGREQGGRYRGVAYESRILVVKLGRSNEGEFPWTTELMRAINYVVVKAAENGWPLSVNISFGNTYGSHDGTSLLSTFIDSISRYGRTSIVAGSGNEGAAGGHMELDLSSGRRQEAELSVGPYETGFSVQIWKYFTDVASITLMTPSGQLLGPLEEHAGKQEFIYRDTKILVYYGFPSPYSLAQEIYFDFIPRKDYVESGIWRFILDPAKVVEGRVDFWLPSAAVLNQETVFLGSVPGTTLTIPSTSALVITVGAYDDAYQTYADFSGRGYTRTEDQVKPDLAAPGVGIVTAKRGGGYEAVTGTSFAAPFVTGSGALMMEWGIVQGNDPFLYGQKLKAYLQRGARQIPGFDTFPNPQIGYGVLCLRDSILP